MVSLQAITESNARLATALPSGLVAVFVGATSGIGEATLKALAKHAQHPRFYFIGRREEEGQRVQADLRKLNPDGEYKYLKYDVSLMRNVDEACRRIQDRESALNLLFLSSGTLVSGKQTDEGLHYSMAVSYYARVRFLVNLLPQLKQASGLRRVVHVGAGGKEGTVYPDDFEAKKLSPMALRGHWASMLTVSLVAAAKDAPEVSFVHAYPSFVKTGLSRELTGIGPAIAKILFNPIMSLVSIPIDETGERQAYFATSARFPPQSNDAVGVSPGQGIEIGVGADGKHGSGVYSINQKAEGTSPKTVDLVKEMGDQGIIDQVWTHTQEQFERISQLK
jgi:NAD(P)-dependent dehydrogenase (short-subunit alcohol dehydrogenase family)